MTQRHFTVCQEGWCFLFLFVFVTFGSWLRDINLLVLVAGMLLGIFIYNIRTVITTMRGVSVRRSAPESVFAGESFMVSVALENAHPRRTAWTVAVEDEVAPEGASRRAAARVIFERVPAKTMQRTHYTGRLLARGRYVLGPLSASTRFPLGLVRCTLYFNSTERITVFPRLGSLTPSWSRLRESLLGLKRVRSRQVTTDGDFASLRDWRSGDSRRWIHWRTSARRGQLVVRQFEHQQNRDLLLVLDLWHPPDATPEHFERVENAIRFAASAVADLCRGGAGRLLLSIAGHETQYLQGTASPMFLRDLLEALAVAQATTDDRLGEVLSRSMADLQPDTSLVIAGSRPLEASAGPLVELPEPLRQLISRRAFILDSGSERFGDYIQLNT